MRNNSKQRREWRRLGAIERAEQPARAYGCCADRGILTYDEHQKRAHTINQNLAADVAETKTGHEQ